VRTLLIRHIASGQAFFSGVLLLALAVLLVARHRQGSATVAWTIGLFLIAVSATPLPLAFYAVAGVLSLAWIIAVRLGPAASTEGAVEDTATVATPESSRARMASKLGIAFLSCWLVGVGLELPYHLMPALPQASASRLTIFADSVTAGMGEGEATTWPALIAASHPVEVIDHSRMGATAGSAAVMAEQHPPQPGIVLLEIGGNDILGSTTVAEFEQTLDELCRRVSIPDRQVAMLELPLPPLFNRYGRVQRQVADRYNIALIPKRVLLSVLLSDATTLDTIHLSQVGHQKMADRVWSLLGPSLSQTPRSAKAVPQPKRS
jgi:acyl-CoA thioesterase I